MYPLLEVRGLRREVGGRVVLTDINFQLETHGDILFVRGPSGVGKSLLLRALACLDHIEGGTVLLHGRPPSALGYPSWRTRVAYVPQSRPSTLSGTPAELYAVAQQLGAQRQRPRGDLPSLVHEMGLEQRVLQQQWGELSGGQSQRAALAIAVALCPEVLLLDEPTAACDPASALKVERVLRTCGAALVWVTHDPAQAQRVGGRLLSLPLGAVTQLPPPPPLPTHDPAALAPPGSAFPFSRHQEQHRGPGERGDGTYSVAGPEAVPRPEAAQGASLLLLGGEELEDDRGELGAGGGGGWEERGQGGGRVKGAGTAGDLAPEHARGTGRGATGAVDVQQQGEGQGQGQHRQHNPRIGFKEGTALSPVPEGAVGEGEKEQHGEEGEAVSALAGTAAAAAPGDGHGAGAPQRRSWLALMGGGGGGSSGGAGGGAAAAAAGGSGGGAMGAARRGSGGGVGTGGGAGGGGAR